MILPVALCCGCGNSSRMEAVALLERISAVDLDAPYARREGPIKALSELPLATAELVKVRDACSKAHGGLLRAE